jgi:hypothetical protein
MTAVEWLYKNLLDNPMSNEDVIYNINVLEQAKEMFEQQIIDTYIHIKKEYIGGMDCYPPQFVVDEAKQYYNETYNK